MEETQSLDLQSTFAEPDFHFSYSRPDFPLPRRLLIRGIEMLTGQPKLERMYREWSASAPAGENFFAAAMRLMNVSLEADFQAWRSLPRHGPLLIVANHPYGVIDGLAIGFLSTLVRSDVKIMSHSLLCQPKEVRNFMLPVDFGGTEEAQHTTMQTRKRAVEWLKNGHVVVVFPAGGVSTSKSALRGHAVDDPWHPFIAKLVRVQGLKIVPVFFHGQNSRLFQLASHVYYPLRLAMLFRESLRAARRTLKVSLGELIDPETLPMMEDRREMMRYLRRVVYRLAGPNGPDGAEEHIWPSYIKFH